MHCVVSTIWQLLEIFVSAFVYMLNADHQGSTEGTLCQSRVSVPLISRLMINSSRGGTTPKNKESGGFHLEAHVPRRLCHGLLQVVNISTNSSMIYMCIY